MPEKFKLVKHQEILSIKQWQLQSNPMAKTLVTITEKCQPDQLSSSDLQTSHSCAVKNATCSIEHRKGIKARSQMCLLKSHWKAFSKTYFNKWTSHDTNNPQISLKAKWTSTVSNHSTIIGNKIILWNVHSVQELLVCILCSSLTLFK